MSTLQENIRSLRAAIRKTAESNGKSETDIQVIAASKTQSIERMRIAFECGITAFGENYVQECVRKYQELNPWSPTPSIDFIGHLQTNKVKFIMDKARLIQSVDSLTLIEKIIQQAKKNAVMMKVLLQVNVGEEPSKSGIPPKALLPFFKSMPCDPVIQVLGLMTIPPYHEDPEKSRPYFRHLKTLLEEIRRLDPTVSELSMGMSHDFQVAIEEGATLIRIGEGIFGPR